MKQQRHNHSIKALGLTAVLLAAVMMLGIASPGFALAEPNARRGKEPIMVSLGDSYSSGEGVEPFYCAGSADRYTQPDWLAHRSRLSWSGRLQLNDSMGNRLVMYQNKAYYSNKTKSYDSFSKNNWYFVASSGAVTASLKGTQNKSFDHDPSNEEPFDHSSVTLDPQLKVFESIEPGTTDYVTMTMGGNDAHFADVFVYAAFNCSFLNVNGMDNYLNNIWDEFYNGTNSIKNRLIRAYNDIHNAAGNQADIIIVGYPKILPKNGFLLFSAKEAKSINASITKLNREMQTITQSLCTEDFKIHFVSVEKAFEGHEIYTGAVKAYINGIKFVRANDLSQTQVISSYSLHPNESGVRAYAACVQECIDQIEQQKWKSSAEQQEQNSGENAGDLSEEGTVAQPEPDEASFYSQSNGMHAPAGEEISIPVTLSSNVLLKQCALHFEYDNECLQIHSVSSAQLCEDSIRQTIGTSENSFDVNWSSTDSAVESGTLFYLNATVLKPEETVIHAAADAENTVAKYNRSVALRCEDIVINAGGIICTLTADLSALGDLNGAQVFPAPNSSCTLFENEQSLCAQTNSVIPVVATAAQAELCFYKPGYTALQVVIDSICAGTTIDLTDTLTKAAQERPLLHVGDVNGDGCVSIADVSKLLSPEIYGAAVAETDEMSDLNGDGFVTYEDIAMVLLSDNYGATDLTITYQPA